MAAAAANTIRAMDATASPPGMFAVVRSPELAGRWGGAGFGAGPDAAGRGVIGPGVMGPTSWPTGRTLPSSANPQSPRLVFRGGPAARCGRTAAVRTEC